MLIANPIYDVVFKLLLEDNPVAKFLVGTIMGCEVLSLEPIATERSKMDVQGLTVYRMDFAGTIQVPDGGTRRVIIEMQKAKALSDVQRFREYLGREYIKSEHPIIAIYFLGFNLQSKSAAFTVDRTCRDLETGEMFDDDDYWVHRLTHPAYFIQTLRIDSHTRTKLGMLLSVFAQENFVSGDSQTLKAYLQEPECPEMKALLAILQYAAADAETRRVMEEEASAARSVERMFRERDRQREEDRRQLADRDRQIAEHERQNAEHERQIAEHERQIAEHERQIADRDRQIAEHERQNAEHERQNAEHERQNAETQRQIADRDRQIAEDKQRRAETAMAIDEYRQTLRRFAKRIRDDGVPCAEVSQETGLTVQEIDSM